MIPKRNLSPVLPIQKNLNSEAASMILPEGESIANSNSMSFAKKKQHFYIAKTINDSNSKSPIPMSSRGEINKSIREAENEDEDHINTSIDHHECEYETRNIFQTHKNYDPNLYNELSMGPKFKKNGQLIPYSIIGKSDSFLKNYNILKSRNLENNPMKSYNVLDELKTPKSSNLKPQKLDSSRNPPNPGLSRKQSFRSTSESIDKGGVSPNPNRKPPLIKVNKEQLLKEIADFEKKRQELIKKDEAELKALKLSDWITVTKEKRILEQFDRNNEKWKQEIEKLCNSINRSLDQTVMLQYEEYRKNREKAEEIERLKESIKKRFAVQDERSELFWYLSLRNYPKDQDNLQPRFANHDKCKRIEDESDLKRVGRLTLMQDLPNGFQTGIVESRRNDVEKIREPFLRQIRGSINKSSNSFTSKYNVNIIDAINQTEETSFLKNQNEDDLDDLEVCLLIYLN